MLRKYNAKKCMVNEKNGEIVGSEGCCHSEMNDGKDLERGGSSDIKVPCRESYLLMGAVYAGEYPGAKEENASKLKVAQLYRFGVRHFVDLTEEGELCPYESLLPSDATHYRFPIKDVSVPTDVEAVHRLLHKIDEWEKTGGYVYIHCWGGVGRTGTIAACYLLHKMALPDAAQALKMMQARFATMPKSKHKVSPETQAHARPHSWLADGRCRRRCLRLCRGIYQPQQHS